MAHNQEEQAEGSDSDDSDFVPKDNGADSESSSDDGQQRDVKKPRIEPEQVDESLKVS